MSTRFVIAALASTMLASAANAATFFTDAGAFAAATTGLTSGNFAGIVGVGSFTSQPSFTVAGVTFDNAGFDFVIDGGFFNNGFYGSAPYYSGQANALTTISFAGTSAFGMVFGNYASDGGALSFTLSDGSVFNASFPAIRGNSGFFGFTSTTPITSISVNNQAGGANVFDVVSFSVGAAAVVPEPQSWALLIAGFGLTGAALRRRRAAIA
jgi:hypothetical protein